MNCLNGFESESIRNDHHEYCKHKDSVRVEMPTKDKSIVKYFIVSVYFTVVVYYSKVHRWTISVQTSICDLCRF